MGMGDRETDGRTETNRSLKERKPAGEMEDELERGYSPETDQDSDGNRTAPGPARRRCGSERETGVGARSPAGRAAGAGGRGAQRLGEQLVRPGT